MGMRIGFVAGIIAVLFAAGCSGGPHRGSPGAHGEGVDQEPLAVAIFAAGGDSAAAAEGTLILPARVEARSEVTLEARIPGRVTRLSRREGESFRAGETLAEFAAPEAAAAVAAARARLASAIATDQRASRQEARLESLEARGVVAVRDLELAETAARAAAAERAASAADLERLSAGTRLVAPFAGVVVRRHVDTGADVSAGEPVLDLRSLESGGVAADLPESALESLDGASYDLSLGDGPWQPARLVRVEGMINRASRSRRAWFSLRDAGPGTLEPGAFARVRVAGPGLREARNDGGDAATTPRPILVPSHSLVRRGGLSGVFVVVDDRARLRWVRLGRAHGASVEVAAGLVAGDRVVLDPADVSDGRPVVPRP